MAPDLNDGAFVVWLADLTDPALVLPTIAETLSVRAIDISLSTLAEAIGDMEMMLLLDNMEHLLPAAPLIPELLQRCPNLKVLVTSRTRLRVSGEDQWPLPPLSVAATGLSDTRQSAETPEAEVLFVMRARSADPYFDAVGETSALVTAICERVNGLPLAIELAAGQLSQISLDEIATRAERLLPVLTDGPSDQPRRLQTMQASVEWSFSLLSPAEQSLLMRLGVFRGGFTLEAARVIGFPEQQRDIAEHRSIGNLVGALVERNLVSSAVGKEPVLRFSLLEVIREFADDQLEITGVADEIRDAHADFYFDLAVRHAIVDWIPGDPGLPERFETELPNLREALAWFEKRNDGERMLRFAAALDWFWNTHNHAIEGRTWLERAMAVEADTSPAARAMAALVLAQVESYLGYQPCTDDRFEVGVDDAIEANDPFLMTWAFVANAATAIYCGDYLRGKVLCEQAMKVIERIENEPMRQALHCWLPGTLARAEHGLGNLDRASDLLRDAVQVNMDLGHLRGAARFLGNQGTLAVDLDDLPGALTLYLESASLANQDGDDVYAATTLRLASAAFALSGDFVASARLLGAIQAFEEHIGPLVMWTPMDTQVLQQGVGALHAGLDALTLNREMADGGQFSLAEAIREATQSLISLERALAP